MKEVVEISCPNCNHKVNVPYNGEWTTENGNVYKRAKCTECGVPFLVKREEFDEVQKV